MGFKMRIFPDVVFSVCDFFEKGDGFGVQDALNGL